MGRTYGRDTESAQQATEEVKKLRDEIAKLQLMIERGLACAFLLIGLVVLIYNLSTVFSNNAQAARRGEQTVAEQAIYEDLQTKAEIAASVDVSTLEPKVGKDTVYRYYQTSNVYTAGKAIADMQNEMGQLVMNDDLKSSQAYISEDDVAKYFDGSLRRNVTGLWARSYIDNDIDVVWVFDTDYLAENWYVEGTVRSADPGIRVVWRCYAKDDALTQERLYAFATATYYHPTQIYPEKTEGYFKDVQIVLPTGYGAIKLDEAEALKSGLSTTYDVQDDDTSICQDRSDYYDDYVPQDSEDDVPAGGYDYAQWEKQHEQEMYDQYNQNQ